MAVSETGGKGIPCVFAMLPNKQKITYETLFNKIKEMVGVPSRVQTIITDFEKAVFSACEKVFPDAVHKGCRFHMNAAIWRKLGDLGLHPLFHQNQHFQEFIYKIYSLSYVPEDQVVSTYNDVILPIVQYGLDEYQDWIEYSDELEQFGIYYSNTWITWRNGRAPLFSPSLWNHYTSVKEDEPQTNNMLESHNRTWNSLVGYKPNVWVIQELFIKQDAEARRNYLSNAVGQDMHTNTGRKQRSLHSCGRVKFVVDAFESMSRSDYISTLAHNIQKYA
jgi:hypothetical protein